VGVKESLLRIPFGYLLKKARYLKIMKPLLLACLISFVCIPNALMADTWRDPSFKEMMEQSELIGVFRVVEGGAFKARLVPVSIYKGRVSGEIWIGGFSNKYGPIDTLEIGQSYLLFINNVKRHKSRYGSSSNAGNQTIAQASYEASVFVRSQKNGYFVPTPTSGEYRVVDDKVFIDLSEVNNRIEGFPLQDLKRLLEYQFKSKDNLFVDYCKTQARRNLQKSNVFFLTNYLTALELTAPVAYDELFKEIALNTVWQARFTLAKLLGKVKGNESRDLLVSMLSDSVGVVQGEAIRQLAKNESPSFLGPLLLRQLDSASNEGLYPSLMSAVRNTRESGKIEIINSLAEMNYKEAIPHLTSLLKTKDEYVFERTLQALLKLGSTEFIKPLNDRLRDPDLPASILFDITRVIKDQQLIQCKDGLLAQLAKHNRNDNRNKTIALSTLVTLAERDSSIESSILNDFENFFTYYDTLQSFNQRKWIAEYLAACARLKSEEARPLVYRALFEWSGFNPQMFTTVGSFRQKLEKEDSIQREFSNTMGSKGYRMNSVIHFASVTSQRPKFLVSIIAPDGNASFTFERRKFLADQIGIEEENVFLKADGSWCWLDCQERFNTNDSGGPMSRFISYAEACPNERDLKFLKSLMASGRWEAKYFDRELSRAVLKIEAALSSRKN
jgi:hypothetical protein